MHPQNRRGVFEPPKKHAAFDDVVTAIVTGPHTHQKDVIVKQFYSTVTPKDKEMYLDSSKKTELFGQYGKSATDTGSAESQIALFTFRIKHLTEHLKANHKDYKTARSLTKLVGKRRSLLDYLYDRDINRYRAIVKALGLRK